jgi:sugar lactone lactonase YvrE
MNTKFARRSIQAVAAIAAAITVLVSPTAAPQGADSVAVGTITNFGPDLQTAAGGVCRQPEGIALDPDGNLYLASNSDAAIAVGHICVLDPAGNLKDIIDIPAGPGATAVPLVGELFENGNLYVCDEADDTAPHGRVLKVNPRTHQITTVVSGLAFPNGMAEDRHGNMYVTDSILGRIYKFDPDDNNALAVWLESPLLLSHNPNLPVGANDLAFDQDQDFLYVSQAGDRRVFRVPLHRDGTPGDLELFADGATLDQRLGLPSPTALYYADGMQFDVNGNLYVMANRADEVDVLSPGAHLIHRYAGTGVNGMSFNASPIFRGRQLFMTNVSAVDGGVNSKVSVLQAPYPGISLQ